MTSEDQDVDRLVDAFLERLRPFARDLVRQGQALQRNRIIQALDGAGALLVGSTPAVKTHVVIADHTARTDSRRAGSGHVKRSVLAIVQQSPNGITANDISAAGDGAGNELKPSSVRMALLKLRDEGRVSQQDGKWFPANDG